MQLSRGTFIALISLISILLCLVIALPLLSYSHAKRSYWLVGFNDGAIENGMKTIARIREIYGSIGNCNASLSQGAKIQELLNVKDETIYASQVNSGAIELCEYK